MISISCLESKLLNNNNWYGRFQLAPFQKGEGLTVANALRRTLLAEKSNFFITWVDFYNAEIPYSVLTGMRESIFDILLNLKQVIFTSDTILPNNSHFFKMPSNNDFSTQKVKFFSGSAGRSTTISQASPVSFILKDTKCNEAMGWNPEEKSKNGLNIAAKDTSNYAKQVNQYNALHGDLNRINSPSSSFLKQKKLGVKKQRNPIQTIHKKSSKNFTTSQFSVNRQKNILIPYLNQSTHKLLPIIKNNRTNKALEFGTWGTPLNFKNQKSLTTQNVFCQNQILGKTINSEHKTSYLLPLRIFRKDIDSISQLNTYNSKKMTNSTYIGYICAKGPATIYAKNIKLPKGLKCVDPDKYIATLADDGLFYLRFALTCEIKTLALKDTPNQSIMINQTIKFNQVKLKIFPKILFNKEINSNFCYKINPDRLEKTINKRKTAFESHVESYNSEMLPVNCTKNLINEQRVLLTNDSIKQLDFQNTSVTANIQKTCLLNVQIKHYYYKCGRFDRFLFDLIKPFKPSLKSTRYNQPYLKNSAAPHAPENINQFDLVGATSNWHLFYLIRLFERQRSNSQVLIDRHRNNLRRPIIENLMQKKRSAAILFIQTGRIHKISNSFSLQSNVNSSFTMESKNPNQREVDYQNRLKKDLSTWSKPLKNKYFGFYLIKWQKIFKNFKTSSIYDYLEKLDINEATLICFLLDKANPEKRISLSNSKLTSKIGFQTEHLGFTLACLLKNNFNKDTFSLVNEEYKLSYFGVSKLYNPYLEKFLNGCVSFQSSKNHIFNVLQAYVLQYTSSSNLNKNRKHQKHLLRDFLIQPGFIDVNKLITRIKFLRQWSSFMTEHNKKTKLIKQSYISSNQYRFLNSIRTYTNLRSKPFTFVRQISYKLIEIDSYQFEHHKDKLGSRSLPGFVQAQTFRRNVIYIDGADKLVQAPSIVPLPSRKQVYAKQLSHLLTSGSQKKHLSYLPIESRKKLFNPPTNNSLVLKPVYLNIEQIIYILKQTTRFHKNQRINPIFFDFLNGFQSHNLYPLNSSLIFRHVQSRAKIYNYFYSSFSKPFWLNNTLLPVTTRSNFTDTKTWRCKTSSIPRLRLSHVWILGTDFVFKKNYSSIKFLKNQNYWSWKSISNFNTRFQLPLVIKDQLKLDGQKEIIKQFFFTRFSKYSILKKNYNRSSKHLLFSKNANEKNEFSASTWSVGGVENTKASRFFTQFSTSGPEFSFLQVRNQKNRKAHRVLSIDKTRWPKNVMYNNAFWAIHINSNSNNYLSLFRVDYKSNIKNLYNEPYNINIYHSKISFHLRYTYPFKYTIFETFLPFVNSSEKICGFPLNNLIQNYDIFSLFKNEKAAGQPFEKKINKHNQIINNSRESNELPAGANSKIISSRHLGSRANFDSIQYNESFKIYTTLAYTCLKTYQPHLTKYHNFNRQNQKKSQQMCSQPEYHRSSYCFDDIQPSLFMHINRARWGDISFKSLMQNWTPFQRNNKNRAALQALSFIIKYEKSYHEKPSAYPFLMIPYQLPSIFNSAYKWRIMNNSNFNDAFITIPCNWSLNLQRDTSSNLNNLFYSFLTPFHKFYYVDYIFRNIDEMIFLDQNALRETSVSGGIGPCLFIDKQACDFFNTTSKGVVKNKLNWSKITNRNNESNWLGLDRRLNSYAKKNIKASNDSFQSNNKTSYGENLYNSVYTEPRKKLSRLISKFRTKRFVPAITLKKLAMNFETIYYKNFLWNSQKITLRVLNNAILPLVANRKSSTSDFIAKKNSKTRALMDMPINISYSPKFLESVLGNKKLWGLKQKMRLCLFWPGSARAKTNTNAWNRENFDNGVSQKKNQVTNPWFHQLFFSGVFSKIYNYQKPSFYSVRHKNLGTTNFMCLKIYPSFLNKNQIRTFKLYNQETQQVAPRREPRNSLQKKEKHRLDLTNELQTQPFDDFSESFSSLGSKWRPFLTGSLKYSQAPPVVSFHTKQWDGTQEKDFSFNSPFLHSMNSNVKSNKTSENELVSYNKIIDSQVLMDDPLRPEKLASLRKNQWISKLIKGSKSSNLKDSSKNDSKIKSPLINNLWSSPFFCSYSLYTISIKSDLFLQNLISFSDLNSSPSIGLERNSRSNLNNLTQDEFIEVESGQKNTSTNNNETPFMNETKTSSTNLRVLKKNLKETHESIQAQSERNHVNHFSNSDLYLKSYNKTIQKVLKSQNHQSVNFLGGRVRNHANYNYHWQKTIHFTILGRFKGLKFNDKKKKIRSNGYKNQSNNQFLHYPKKNLNSISSNSISLLKNQYLIRRLKNFERYFGNPLRRRINQDELNFYNITLPTELYKQFATNKFKKANQHIIKSWKSTICTIEAQKYFCFRYPLFIQNCHLPWQKSKQLFYIPPHWLNRLSRDFKPLVKKVHSTYLSKTRNIHPVLNTDFFMTYTQLSSSSNQTHQFLSPNQLLKNITSSIYMHPQNKGSSKMINYFTIKENVNSIYKVNYIVESQAFESKPMSELAFHSNQNLHRGGVNRPQTFMEGSHSIKRFGFHPIASPGVKRQAEPGNTENHLVTHDSLTISNFLNGTYSFIPSKTIILHSFNELIDSKINQSKIENENEYIQIDIWTNGEISPRQALLNAFRKLFELFYNLSKYNCLKPIEI